MRNATILVAAVLLAGCTAPVAPGGDDGGSPAASDGLSIALAAADSTVRPGSDVRVSLDLRNIGGHDADVSDIAWSGAPFMTADACTQQPSTGSIPQMAAPDRDGDAAGDSVSILYSCPYPSDALDPGVSDTFPVNANVSYTYRTVASTTVTIVPPAEFSGGAAASSSATGAPVTVRIDTPGTTTPPEDGSLTVPVTVRNVADGTAGEVSLSTSDGLSCPGTVSLINGRRTIECSLDTPGSVDVERSERLQITAAYSYWEVVSTTVRLAG